uniref:Uncharacterized protein n=1 Tax=Lactuca sativa TaxID=4236 RepID=A0A9R1XVJ2_LACSA|nr:hypothetical protein LSAT_V11C100048340 [Lactuca sativa]
MWKFRKETFFYGHDNQDQLVKIARLELEPQLEAIVRRQLIFWINSFAMIIRIGSQQKKQWSCAPLFHASEGCIKQQDADTVSVCRLG